MMRSASGISGSGALVKIARLEVRIGHGHAGSDLLEIENQRLHQRAVGRGVDEQNLLLACRGRVDDRLARRCRRRRYQQAGQQRRQATSGATTPARMAADWPAAGHRRSREFQADDQAAAGPVEQAQGAAMGIGHRLDDGEAEAAAGGSRPGGATPEALQHLVLFGIRNAGAAIGHVDQEAAAVGTRAEPDRDVPPRPAYLTALSTRLVIASFRLIGSPAMNASLGLVIDVEPDQDIIGDRPGALDHMVQKGWPDRLLRVPALRYGGSPSHG